jgi:hypothetical protein
MEEMRREGIGFKPVRRKGSRRFQGEEIEARKRGARRVVETGRLSVTTCTVSPALSSKVATWVIY